MTPVCALIVLVIADNAVVVLIAAHSVLVSAEMTKIDSQNYCASEKRQSSEVETERASTNTAAAVVVVVRAV